MASTASLQGPFRWSMIRIQTSLGLHLDCPENPTEWFCAGSEMAPNGPKPRAGVRWEQKVHHRDDQVWQCIPLIKLTWAQCQAISSCPGRLGGSDLLAPFLFYITPECRFLQWKARFSFRPSPFSDSLLYFTDDGECAWTAWMRSVPFTFVLHCSGFLFCFVLDVARPLFTVQPVAVIKAMVNITVLFFLGARMHLSNWKLWEEKMKGGRGCICAYKLECLCVRVEGVTFACEWHCCTS